MPDAATSSRIDEQLAELYERHVSVPEGATEAFYESGREYFGLDQAGAAADTFGIALAALDGELFSVGDSEVAFALQSISKVLVYGLALQDHGRERVLERVGVEPSGDAFNSIVFDERRNKPYNPMVNAGALVATDMVKGKDPEEKLGRILEMMRLYAANDSLDIDQQTFERELETADRNRATAYLMRSQGMLESDIDETLELYLKQCSVKVTCRDLAMIAGTIANGCENPQTCARVLPRSIVRDVLSVMYTCGMYDFAGEWAFDVGVPAKSGVSGGILVPVPGKMGMAVFSPGLDRHGNSVRGIRVCEDVSGRLGLHVFATEGEDRLIARG